MGRGHTHTGVTEPRHRPDIWGKGHTNRNTGVTEPRHRPDIWGEGHTNRNTGVTDLIFGARGTQTETQVSQNQGTDLIFGAKGIGGKAWARC